MLGEVGFDVGLGGYSGGILVSGRLYACARGAGRAPASSIHSSGMTSSSRFEQVDLRLAYSAESGDDGAVVRLTIAGKVSQVESRCRNLSHDGRRQPDVARSGFPRILGVVLAELGRASRAAGGPD